MKTFKTILFIAVTLFVATARSIAADNVRYQDAEEFARAYLRTKTTHYVLLVGTRIAGTDQWLNMEYTMDARTLMITNFNVYDTNVPLLKPLSGLPIPTNGYVDFNLTIVGYDAARNRSCHGSWYTNTLVRGDSIHVAVLPEVPPAVIPFVGDDPNAFELLLDGISAGYYYDYGRKAFVVWPNESVDTDYVRATYTIRNRATHDIPAGGRGIINFLKGVEIPSESPANIGFVAGLVEVQFSAVGGKYQERQSLPFDSVVTRGGKGVSAKVLMVRDIGRRSIYMYVSRVGAVEVRRVEQDDVVPMSMFYNSGNLVGYRVDMPLDDARITVFPNDQGDQTFDIHIGN